VAAAKDVPGASVPPILETFWTAKSLSMPLTAGGYLDQDVGMYGVAMKLDFIFRTIKRWRSTSRLEKQESDLILRLAEQGMM